MLNSSTIKNIRSILVIILDDGIVNTVKMSAITRHYNRCVGIMIRNDLIKKHYVKFSSTLHKSKLNRCVYTITRKGIRYMYRIEKIDLHN
jgi:hypothetical protein